MSPLAAGHAGVFARGHERCLAHSIHTKNILAAGLMVHIFGRGKVAESFADSFCGGLRSGLCLLGSGVRSRGAKGRGCSSLTSRPEGTARSAPTQPTVGGPLQLDCYAKCGAFFAAHFLDMRIGALTSGAAVRLLFLHESPRRHRPGAPRLYLLREVRCSCGVMPRAGPSLPSLSWT